MGVEHRPMLDVVAAVIRNEQRVLACRRNADRARGGLWEFPGGKVEPGETHATALKREIREELDVEVVVGELVAQVTAADDGIVLWAYESVLAGPVPRHSSDHDRMLWADAVELQSLNWAPADVPISEIVIQSF